MRKLIFTLLVLTLGMSLGSSHLLANGFSQFSQIGTGPAVGINIPSVNVVQNIIETLDSTTPAFLSEDVDQYEYLSEFSFPSDLVHKVSVVKTELILAAGFSRNEVITYYKGEICIPNPIVPAACIIPSEEPRCIIEGIGYHSNKTYLFCETKGLQADRIFKMRIVKREGSEENSISPKLVVKNLAGYSVAEDTTDVTTPPADDPIVDDLPVNDDPAIIPPEDGVKREDTKIYIEPYSENAGGEENGFACSLNKNSGAFGMEWLLMLGALGLLLIVRYGKLILLGVLFFIPLFYSIPAQSDTGCGWMNFDCFIQETVRNLETSVSANDSRRDDVSLSQQQADYSKSIESGRLVLIGKLIFSSENTTHSTTGFSAYPCFLVNDARGCLGFGNGCFFEEDYVKCDGGDGQEGVLRGKTFRIDLSFSSFQRAGTYQKVGSSLDLTFAQIQSFDGGCVDGHVYVAETGACSCPEGTSEDENHVCTSIPPDPSTSCTEDSVCGEGKHCDTVAGECVEDTTTPNYNDADDDGVDDDTDNCPANDNADQTDTDGDEVGDECDECEDQFGEPEFQGCPENPNPGEGVDPNLDSGESCSLSKSSKAGIFSFLPFLLFASLIFARRSSKTVSRKRRSPRRARSRAARA